MGTDTDILDMGIYDLIDRWGGILSLPNLPLIDGEGEITFITQSYTKKQLK